MRRIAIVGTRAPNFANSGGESNAVYRAILDDVRDFCESIRSIVELVLVSGGARGVDSFAEQFFAKRIIHLPNYELWGTKAPLERNDLIVRDCDELHAWPSPWSRGTHDTIRKARAAGKPTTVHEVKL